MATTLEHLRSISAYPIPAPVLTGAGIKWGIDLSGELTQDVMRSKAYNLCRADLLVWLSRAPNISQGGQSYSFNDDQRQQLLLEAQAIRKEYGENVMSRYGYKGSRL